MAEPSTSPSETDALAARVRELEAALSAQSAEVARLAAERDQYRKAYEQLLEQHELLRRRIVVAKAERVDVAQLELEFEQTKAKLDLLAATLGITDYRAPDPEPRPEDKPRSKPKGRRNLDDSELPEERVEITHPELEGKAEVIGTEESWRLAYRRGGAVRLRVVRKVYKQVDDAGAATITTADAPKELCARLLASPSMLAHILFEKYGMGVPFYRQEARLELEQASIDRSTMCRYSEDVGASLGAIVEAAAHEARQSAFCLSTDATGVAIQPEPLPDGKRQACRKGHFFVVLADRDHIFFEYQPKHTSAAVCAMFRGFSGYIQADAHAIYDAVFRGEASAGADPPKEVGCWSHARRKFWEAAISKHKTGGDGLYRIRRMFELDASWAQLAPEKRKLERRRKLAPLIDEFFEWARGEQRVHTERGLVATALGYAVRQEQALRRFLEDGRLKMENNAAERGLRTIAVGRKNWLFFGADDNAAAAANIFSLIASAKLHDLEPETYLAELIRVMPYWPRDRYLELAPKYWAATRATLDPGQLANEVGPLDVPPPEQKSSPS